MRRPLVLLAALQIVVLAAVLAVPGCSAGPSDGEVTVFAAASLTEAFTELAGGYEANHPGTTVTISFGASSTLAQQISAGAPADVFAAADRATMARVDGLGPAQPQVFARNRLVIAVPLDNPRRIAAPADLTRPGVRVAVCAPQVPCGAAARRALDAAGARLTPATLETDVKATLTKLRLGEVDAALVYRTDAIAARREVRAVEFPEPARVVNDYPIVALPEAANPAGAAAFVEYVLSPPAQRTLADAGFLPR